VEVVKVALPLTSVLVPRVVVPSVRVTLPVGVPVRELTVAVRVTDCPNTEGLTEEVRRVVVGPPMVRVKDWLASEPIPLWAVRVRG
jgi:hypothetical protein